VVRALHEAGGAMLEALAVAPMSADACAQALTRIDAEAGTVPPARRDIVIPATVTQDITFQDDEVRRLAPTLRTVPMGDWHWAGPGLHWRPIDIGSEGETRAFLLKAEPGMRMPEHTHTGTEWTAVLTGAYVEEGGRFARGDFECADTRDTHRPIVENDEVCICLVAMQGQLQLKGFVGRLLQPLVRF
jgi:putative transcriptional regulator